MGQTQQAFWMGSERMDEHKKLFSPATLEYSKSMRIPALMFTLLLLSEARGETYALPALEFDLVGTIHTVEALQEDTLLDVARRHDIGQEEIVRANPDIDRWLPGAGTKVTIPSRYILPPSPRRGLVLNLPEMRLYYYPEAEAGQTVEVQTYPVSIGRMDWATPLGETTLIAKEEGPGWRPPQSIRREHEEDGDPLPEFVPPGPDNPLGKYAMRLGIPGYLIHGTNKAFGVGMRVSHGCIRMLPEDIEELYPQVPIGTEVRIINQPVKAGWYGGELYVEIHPPLSEDQVAPDALEKMARDAIDEALFRRPGKVNEEAIEKAMTLRNGVPFVISEEP